MRIFHIATADDWAEAQRTGAYTTSTYGQSLEAVGFIHCSRADQWRAVRERFYADVTEPLVLLEIESDRLASPWREDTVGDETFPHIYGPLDVSAVVAVHPL